MSKTARGWLIAGSTLFIFWGLGSILSWVSHQGSSPRKVSPWPPVTQAPFQADLPTLSHLRINQSNSHLCSKPDDAVYSGLSNRVVGGGERQYHNPGFLFDTHNQDDTINWANGFKGTVPVCFVVDVKGNPTNIVFFQSPGNDIESHIRERIQGWRYKPGTYINGWRDQDPKPIPTQVAFDFTFE